MADRGSIEVLVGATTDQGRVRTNNEDGFLIRPPVYAVADGMGGMNAGEVASAVALETMGAVADLADGRVALSEWIGRANHAVFERAHQDQSAAGMGTTLVAVVPDGDRLRLAHVGDSRAYMLRGGLLFQLTDDHTKVNRMVKEGLLTPEEAERHPERNVITRALGIQDSVQSDETTVDVHEGDRLVLCTDGLSGMIDAGAIRSILLAEADPQEASLILVQAANEAGGGDNVTALVLDITHVTPGAGSPDEPVKLPGRRRMAAWVGSAVVAVALVAAALALLRSGTGESAASPSEVRSTSPPGSSSAPPPTVTVVMNLADMQKALQVAATRLKELLPKHSKPESPFPSITNALDQPSVDTTQIGNDLAKRIPSNTDLTSVEDTPPGKAYDTNIESQLHDAVEGLQDAFKGYANLADQMKNQDRPLHALRLAETRRAAAFADAYRAFWSVDGWDEAASAVGLRPPAPTSPSTQSSAPAPPSSGNSSGNGSGSAGSGRGTG